VTSNNGQGEEPLMQSRYLIATLRMSHEWPGIKSVINIAWVQKFNKLSW
jgi:hypothetical protein